MKRSLILILVLIAAAHASQRDAAAQSRRVRPTEPPKNEHNEKSEPREDGAKGETQDKSADKSQDKTQDEPQGEKKDDDDQPLTGNDVMVRARIKSKPEPVYPRGARRYGVQGTVKLRIILGADGKVREQMEILEGLPHGLTEEAIRVARMIEFEPARKGGRPVSQYVTVLYHFRLH